MEEEKEYPGQCEGMYSSEAEECRECDIAEQCKRVTNAKDNKRNVDSSKGKRQKTT